MENLSERLCSEMEARHLSSARLANMSGVQRTTIDKICKGETTSPGIETLSMLSSAMGISLAGLLGIPSEKTECDVEKVAADLRESYERLFAEQKESHMREIAFLSSRLEDAREDEKYLREQNKKTAKERNISFTVITVMFILVILFLIVDIANPEKGWFQGIQSLFSSGSIESTAIMFRFGGIQ